MDERAKLLQEADEAFTELQRATVGLTEEQMVKVWFGTWGVREILIHISGWHRAMILALQRVARGEPPYSPGTYDDFDAWNARFVAEKTGVKVADVRVELEASHRDFLRAATAVPEHHFAAARELLDGAGTGHYREHTGQIRGWRAR
ncbi:MAG: ClbS/DfsB family four-helix bundle protein [Candidatus Rokuibacteriota bacterium]